MANVKNRSFTKTLYDKVIEVKSNFEITSEGFIFSIEVYLFSKHKELSSSLLLLMRGGLQRLPVTRALQLKNKVLVDVSQRFPCNSLVH